MSLPASATDNTPVKYLTVSVHLHRVTGATIAFWSTSTERIGAEEQQLSESGHMQFGPFDDIADVMAWVTEQLQQHWPTWD
jgi:hypothetical protein